MNNEIILRIRSPQGQSRITTKLRDTFGQLLLQISKKLNYLVKDLLIQTEQSRPLNVSEGKKLGDIPYFKDGAILLVNSKTPHQKTHVGVDVATIKKSQMSSKCNHLEGGKCLNCLSSNDSSQEGDKQKKETQTKIKCNHGPGGKCLNCTTVDNSNKQQKLKWLCQHGPNAKCCHCLDKQYISDIAHISFDNYLEQKKLKCKGVHPDIVKCNNCLPPMKMRYDVDLNCKNHEPYPKARCNKCLPPNVVIKRQEYRHVDYVQFMNIAQIQNLVQYWVQKKHMAEQRIGYLYGYYAEDDRHYKGGIRVIVESIYEPKQKGSYSDFQITQTAQNSVKAEMIANGLTLERVGWIFTETNHDCVMSQQQVKMAAKFQEEYRVSHSSGYEISNFITVILRTDKDHPQQVKPQVYMISDQGQALQQADLFIKSRSRRFMQVKVAQNNKEVCPSFICGGKQVTEFQPQFLLVKLAHGSSKSNKFAILKKSEFPCLNRDEAPSMLVFREYLKKNKNKSSWLKYGDFNFLLYLAEIMDIHTAMSIAQGVVEEKQIAQSIDELIQHKADL